MITKMLALSLVGLLFFSGTIACQKEAKDSEAPIDNITDPIGNQPTGEGTAWLTGAADPAEDLGKEADFYIQTTSGDLFRRYQGVWTQVMGMRGATGAQGVAGVTGAVGPQGSQGSAGAPGVAGAKGDKGATGERGATGATGATGSVGATGAQGVAGLPGAKGDKGDKGDRGQNGLGSNVIALFADHGGKDAVYTADRDLKVTIPGSLIVLYGTGAVGTAYVSIGKKIICSYRGGSVYTKDPAPGTEDYELGKIYRLSQCAIKKDNTYDLDSPQSQDTFGLATGETLRLSVATAGNKIPGARVGAIMTVNY